MNVKANIIDITNTSINKILLLFSTCSLCTTLCLQWESDIISIALIFLASKLSKYEITDWKDKPPGCKKKWYEFFEPELSLDLLEGNFFISMFFLNKIMMKGILLSIFLHCPGNYYFIWFFSVDIFCFEKWYRNYSPTNRFRIHVIWPLLLFEFDIFL